MMAVYKLNSAKSGRCHQSRPLWTMPWSTEVAEFAPKSATGNRHYVAKIPAPLGL